MLFKDIYKKKIIISKFLNIFINFFNKGKY